jgi:hypothetical protein
VKIRRPLLSTFLTFVVGLGLPAFAVAPTTGKFVFTFTVTVNSTLPKNAVVVCYGNANVNESSGQSISQSAIGIATPSGGKATCIATMPYLWELVTPSSDRISLSYKVEVDYALELTAANGTGTTVQLASSDKVNQNLASIAVPVDGTTTNEAVSVTL